MSDSSEGTPSHHDPSGGDRRRSVPWTELRLTGLADVAPTMDAVLRAMESYGYSLRDVYAVELSLHEALVNALRHGNGLDPALTVRLRFALTHQEFLAEVEDEGKGFDPRRVPDPTGDEHLGHCGGRGVFLMRTYMTHVRFNDRGNCVTLIKRRGTRVAC